MRILCTLTLQLLLALVSIISLYAQDTLPKPPTVFDYLTEEEGATIQLNLDFTALLENRKKADYISATMTDKTGKTFELEVRTRGKFRRKRCEIPPIKLKFSKTGLVETQLDTMNEIKLVLPCAGKEADESLIVREYLTYRMFEKLSPDYCVRARLIRLQLKDKAKKRPQKMLAMLVEHEEQVAGRTGSAVFQDWGIKAEQLHEEQAALAVLFEFMIGNTDWDIASCRNMMLLRPSGDEKICPVPYDFDFSGLVSAPYSSPNSDCNIRSVKDRCLMDYGISSTALQRARQTLIDAKPMLYDGCRSRFLAVEASDDMAKFLDVFFDVIANSAEIPSRMEFSDK